ncbi:MAG: recombinase family protein [Defluviitaleaceae bacterium]|nr:recombinase family protein [Defluviitaleaceae bacterium]
MTRTAIYVRVSTEEQAREGYSIRAQEEKLRSYAAIKDWPVHAVYADEGISAKDIEGRPAIKRMLADVADGTVNNVLVYKIDRLTRSTKNLIELVDLFNRHKCAFNSLNESIDTATATGRMFIKIVGIFAEFERENLAERVRMGNERKVKEGFTPAAIYPSYGYTRTPGGKVQTPHPQEAEVVRRIFAMYLHGNDTLTQIARTLDAEKIPTKRGKTWSAAAVKLILRNPNYIGRVRYSIKDEARYFEADGKHEPILSEATFSAAQEKLTRTQDTTPTKRASAEAYFCGVLYCAACGGKYTTKWSRKADGITKVINYRCINAMKNKCNEKNLLNHNKIEQAFQIHTALLADNWHDLNSEQRQQALHTYVKKIVVRREPFKNKNAVVIDAVE